MTELREDPLVPPGTVHGTNVRFAQGGHQHLHGWPAAGQTPTVHEFEQAEKRGRSADAIPDFLQ